MKSTREVRDLAKKLAEKSEDFKAKGGDIYIKS
jgi:hypothetical protein